MKVVVSILVALLNAALTIYGLYTALPAFRGPSVVAAIAQLIVVTVPFATVSVYAFRSGPRWLWSVALVVNLLVTLGVLALGFFGSANPAYKPLAQIAVLAGVFPLINLAFLLFRPPKQRTSTEASSKSLPEPRG